MKEKMLIVYEYTTPDQRRKIEYKYINRNALYDEIHQLVEAFKKKSWEGSIYGVNENKEIVAQANVRKRG